MDKSQKHPSAPPKRTPELEAVMAEAVRLAQENASDMRPVLRRLGSHEFTSEPAKAQRAITAGR